MYKRLRSFIVSVYYVLVQSHLEYCNVVLLPPFNIQKKKIERVLKQFTNGIVRPLWIVCYRTSFNHSFNSTCLYTNIGDWTNECHRHDVMMSCLLNRTVHVHSSTFEFYPNMNKHEQNFFDSKQLEQSSNGNKYELCFQTLFGTYNELICIHFYLKEWT